MDIVVTGRHTEVSERFRRLVEEKLSKIAQLAPKVQRADVELSHERNPRQSQTSEKVEITLRGKGPVIRAEASSDDKNAALDIALGKLGERLRRTRDRRKVHHGRQTPASLKQTPHGSTASEPEADGAGFTDIHGDDAADASPVVIRTKDHTAEPMTLDQALYEMELVGHDWFLFVDSETMRPSVVYRRRGWNYGVIRLAVAAAASAEPEPVVVG